MGEKYRISIVKFHAPIQKHFKVLKFYSYFISLKKKKKSEKLWLNISSAFGEIRPDCGSDLEARFCKSVQLRPDE